MSKLNITSPVGRVVDGSLYEPQTTDAEGKPLVFKTGPTAGQPRVNYYFAIAIKKNPGETHFAHAKALRADNSVNDWGGQIWGLGNQAFPNIAQSPQFAWKIEDGDSLIPNKKGRKNVEREGYPGHWIVKFSGGYAPKVYQQEGSGYVQVMQKDFCKPGYFVEVAFSVEGNGSASQPGVYLNHSMVCFRAYGQEITFGPDVAAAGFGAAPLPAGASAMPLAAAIPMPSTPMPPLGAPPAPLPQSGSAPMPQPPAQAAPAPIPVIPNVGFVQIPAPVPGVPVPPVPGVPVPPVRNMTALANGIAYDAYIANGWTDAMLVQNGMMLA